MGAAGSSEKLVMIYRLHSIATQKQGIGMFNGNPVNGNWKMLL
jgi:hypothetical protein